MGVRTSARLLSMDSVSMSEVYEHARMTHADFAWDIQGGDRERAQEAGRKGGAATSTE